MVTPKTNVFSHYHFCCWKPWSEPQAPAGSLLSPFQLHWQGSRGSAPWAGSRGPGNQPATPHTTHCAWGLKSALLMLDHAARQPGAPGSQQSPSTEGMLSYQQTFFLPVSIIWMGTVTIRRAHRWRFGILMNTFSKTIGRRDIIVINILPLTPTKSDNVWQCSL